MSSGIQQTADDVIAWAISSKGSLIGASMAIVTYDTDTLNLLLARLQSLQHDWPDKVINGIDTVTPGSMWRAVSTTLGRGRLIVGKEPLEDATLTIREPINARTEMELLRTYGDALRLPFKIMHFPSAGLHLNTEVYAVENNGCLKQGGELCLSWGYRPRFFFSDAHGNNRDEEAAHGLAMHLRQAPDQTFTLKTGGAFANVQPLNLFIQPSAHGADNHQTSVHVVAPGATPVLPGTAEQKYLIVTKNLVLPWQLPYLATALFSLGDLRKAGFGWEGVEYLCDLMVGSLVDSEMLVDAYTGVDDERLGIYTRYPNAVLESDVCQPAEYGANPLFLEHHLGGQASALEVFPPTDLATWVLRQPAVGTLENMDEHWYYLPPALDPAKGYEAGKTDVPCALKDTSPKPPVSVDTLECKLGPEALLCYHAVLSATPTHYFKVEEHQGNSRISMFYRPRGETDPVMVDPTIIEWMFLAGEGTVDQQGVVTLCENPATRLTVLAAIEPDETRWYWCWIVIPAQFNVNELIELYNGA